ncbi:MAG TPA: aldo/keto reductase [Gaiellaceae bacterium]
MSGVARRSVGSGGLAAGAVGLGCMGMTGLYGPTDEQESIATIHRALELGVDLLDTSDAYGPFTNEELVGRALAGRRSEALVATKFGLRIGTDGSMEVSGTPDYVRAAVEASLRRLGVDTIDLLYQHRLDRTVPIEETVGAMAGLVHEGNVRYLGLSEVSAATIRRAHAVHPISAYQGEYSLWTREVEAEVLPTLRELGIGFVAYSPLGRGFLTGRFRGPDDFGEGDSRRGRYPRFAAGNFERNLELVDRVAALAAEKDATPSQLAIAWVLAQGDDVVPIPGTKRVRYVEENAAATRIELTPADLHVLAGAADDVAGDRYGEEHIRLLER